MRRRMRLAAVVVLLAASLCAPLGAQFGFWVRQAGGQLYRTSTGAGTAAITIRQDGAGNALVVQGSAGSTVYSVSSAGAVVPVAPQITAGADAALVNAGELRRVVYKASVTPAPGTDCAAAFKAAALTADCTIGTLPAKTVLLAIYADVTVGFTCSATCTGTKVLQAGTAAGGTQVLAASFNVAVTGQAGVADATLGTGMVRAAAIQGGLLGSWSATTPISVRFTSGTGNWGTGSATNVNAGSVTFYLVTEQLP